MPLISQSLTTRDFGVYGVVLSMSHAVSYLRTLGFDAIYTNVLVRHPRLFVMVWRHLSGIQTWWTLCLSICLFFVLLLFLRGEQNAVLSASLVSLPLALFATTESIFFRLHQVQQKAFAVTWRVTFAGCVNVVVTFLTIGILELGYIGWFWGSFCGSLVAFTLMFSKVWIKEQLIPIIWIRWNHAWRWLRISLPILPHYYGVYLLGTSDRLQLDILRADRGQIGIYNAAGLIANFFSILSNASKNAVGPLYISLLKDRQYIKARNLIFVWQALFLICTTFVGFWMPEIFGFFIRTDGMEQAPEMAIWVLMAVNYSPMYVGANSQLFFNEKTSKLWQRSLVAFAINVVSNVVFFNVIGVYGVALSTYITYLFFGYSTFLMRDYIKVSKIDLSPLFWLVMTLVATLVVLFMSTQLMAIKLGATFSILVVGLLFFFFMNRQKKFFDL